MSAIFNVKKIDTQSKTVKMVKEFIAIEAPLNLFVNDVYVITLLSTPEYQKELALGWLFDEGVLKSLKEVKQVVLDQNTVNVMTEHSIEEDKLRVVSVSRLLTTSCGLSADKFFRAIGGEDVPLVESDYAVDANDLIVMAQKLDEAKLYRSTRGVHVAALFEEKKLVALAEDIGRHNTIDKVVGIGIQEKANLSKCVLVSSGRQPADMVLKAARVSIPIVVSIAAPIRSGIIAAENTGVTLVCFVRNQHMNVYTNARRILTDNFGTYDSSS